MSRSHSIAFKIQLWIISGYLELLSRVLCLLLEQLLTAISFYMYNVTYTYMRRDVVSSVQCPELMKQIVTFNSKQICLRWFNASFISPFSSIQIIIFHWSYWINEINYYMFITHVKPNCLLELFLRIVCIMHNRMKYELIFF